MGPASFVLDAQGRVVSWSVAAEGLFGQSAPIALGRYLSEFVVEEQPEGRRALAALVAGEPWIGTVVLAAGTDAAQKVELTCVPATSTGGATQTVVTARPAAVPENPSLLLYEASRQIGSTLELDRTAREVVEAAVPGFCDAASVYLLERLVAGDDYPGSEVDGSVIIRRLAVELAGVDPQDSDAAFPPDEVVVYPAGSALARCVGGGEPILFETLDATAAERLRRRGAAPALLSQYGEYLAVPMTARGTVLGLTAFARARTSASFSAADQALAMELTARAAVSIDNARLYAQERRTAVALQRSLLPQRLTAPPGLETAHRYLPAGRRDGRRADGGSGHIVGGDWYDLIRLPSDRAALVVGDAMGHGAVAAAAMAQLRTAARVLADLDLPPDEVLHRMDRLSDNRPDAPTATCLYAVIDPARRSCTVARAGHPPPIVALPDGTTRVLDLPPGLPLGLGGAHYQAVHVDLPAGAILAAYTDGLIERRTRDFDHGLGQLRAALAGPHRGLQETCESVIRALRYEAGPRDHPAGSAHDDVTLLLARILP